MKSKLMAVCLTGSAFFAGVSHADNYRVAYQDSGYASVQAGNEWNEAWGGEMQPNG